MPGVVLTYEQRRAGARGFFDNAASLFDALGMQDAAQGIRHYRSGTGTDLQWNDADADRHPLIDAARRGARSRFEAKTFRGLSGNGPGQRTFRDLRDGESRSMTDDWNRDYSLWPAGNDWREQLSQGVKNGWDLITNPSTYSRLGQFKVLSRGRFDGRRDGDDLLVTGTVNHELGRGGDRFDFNPGQPGHDEGRGRVPGRGVGAPVLGRIRG